MVEVALAPGTSGCSSTTLKRAQACGLLGRSALLSRSGAAAGGGRALGTRRPVARAAPAPRREPGARGDVTLPDHIVLGKAGNYIRFLGPSKV